jgi:hypothetical protein
MPSASTAAVIGSVSRARQPARVGEAAARLTGREGGACGDRRYRPLWPGPPRAFASRRARGRSSVMSTSMLVRAQPGRADPPDDSAALADDPQIVTRVPGRRTHLAAAEGRLARSSNGIRNMTMSENR